MERRIVTDPGVTNMTSPVIPAAARPHLSQSRRRAPRRTSPDISRSTDKRKLLGPQASFDDSEDDDDDGKSDISPGDEADGAKGSGGRGRHTTERDLHMTFEADKDEPVLGHPVCFNRTTSRAKSWGRQYVGNSRWWVGLAKKSFPVYGFIKTYKRKYLVGDVAAGLSVAVAAVPMGMSYALLAGVAPAHGLYNNLFHPLVYMLFGTGRQLVVGTSAIESMLSSEAVANVVGWEATPAVWLNATIGFSLCVGIVLTVMRLLGLGVVASFLADPVLSGFSTGSAVVIGTSQLKYLLGLSVPRLGVPETWWYIISHLDQANYGELIIGVAGIMLLAMFKGINRRWFKRVPIPGSLVMMAIFILIGFLMKLDEPPYNVKVIGEIPTGFPSATVFDFSTGIFGSLFQQALWYSVLYFVIHISIAKTIAQQRGYTLDADQEFLATGLCSITGSFFQCFPIASSLSRSCVANMVGAQTPLFNVSNAIVIALTISVITPVLSPLPMASLASVVLFGVYFMMDFKEAYRLLRLFSPDFLLWVTCCTVTVFFGATEGIVASVALSLLWLVKKTAWPNTAVLGRLPYTSVYRNIKRFPMAQEIEGLKIFRFDASLNFANADFFVSKVMALVKNNPQTTSAALSLDKARSIKATAEPSTGDQVITTASSVVSPTVFGKPDLAPAAVALLKSEVIIHSPPPSTQSTAVEGGSSKYSTPENLSRETSISDGLAAVLGSKDIIDRLLDTTEESGSLAQRQLDTAAEILAVPVRVVVIDASSINDVDVTAIRALQQVAKKLESRGCSMLFANWKGPMRDFLEKAQFYDTVPPEHCFLSLKDAVLWAEVVLLKRDPRFGGSQDDFYEMVKTDNALGATDGPPSVGGLTTIRRRGSSVGGFNRSGRFGSGSSAGRHQSAGPPVTKTTGAEGVEMPIRGRLLTGDADNMLPETTTSAGHMGHRPRVLTALPAGHHFDGSVAEFMASFGITAADRDIYGDGGFVCEQYSRIPIVTEATNSSERQWAVIDPSLSTRRVQHLQQNKSNSGGAPDFGNINRHFK